MRVQQHHATVAKSELAIVFSNKLWSGIINKMCILGVLQFVVQRRLTLDGETQRNNRLDFTDSKVNVSFAAGNWKVSSKFIESVIGFKASQPPE